MSIYLNKFYANLVCYDFAYVQFPHLKMANKFYANLVCYDFAYVQFPHLKMAFNIKTHDKISIKKNIPLR